MAAGHDSAILDEGTGGDVGGHVPFLPLVDALQLPGPRQRGAAMRPSPTRDHFGVNCLGLLAVWRAPPAHPPRRQDAPTRRTLMAFALVGHRPALLRARGCGGGHAAAHLSCNRGSRRSSPDMRSAVLVTHPPCHGIRTHPHLQHLRLCLAPRRCYSEGLPSTCGTGACSTCSCHLIISNLDMTVISYEVGYRHGEQSVSSSASRHWPQHKLDGAAYHRFRRFIYCLHRAVRRVSGTALLGLHSSNHLPWRGRAVDRSTTVH